MSLVKNQGYSQAQENHALFFRRSSDGRTKILIFYLNDIILTDDDTIEMA